MGRSRKVLPQSDRIPISDGDWILVKRRLNAGEQRLVNEQSRGPDGPNGEVTIDLVKAGLATVRGALLDWSLGDADETLVIRQKPQTEVWAAIDAIDQTTFVEILRAIETHDEAQRLEREQEKKLPAGTTPAPVTSPLPSAADGASSGSES